MLRDLNRTTDGRPQDYYRETQHQQSNQTALQPPVKDPEQQNEPNRNRRISHAHAYWQD